MRRRTVVQAALLPLLAVFALTVATNAGAQIELPDSASVGSLGGHGEGEEGQSLTFGVIVDAPGGQPTNFEWDFGDGKTLSGTGLSAVAHEFVRGEADYTVSVTVSPAAGSTVTRSMPVKIRNGAPRILNLQAEPDPRPDRPVQFSAEAEDPGTDELEYEWDFGDGSPVVSGTELRRPSHQYSDPGRYVVTLTVRDEEAEVTKQITVTFGDLVAQITGDLTREVEGTTGPATLFAGFMPLNVGVPEHGVGRLSADQCMIYMGFWDDQRRIHVNFLWLPPPDRIFQPGEYVIADSTKEAPAPGTVHGQVHVMTSDAETYQRARANAETAPANVNKARAMANVVGNMIGGLIRNRGGGDNAMLVSAGGTLTIRRASESAISGEVTMHATGPLTRSTRMIGATLEGRFTWRPALESTRTALADCQKSTPFTIVAHKPNVEEKGIDFLSPGVQVTFSRRYKPETITDQNVQIGILNGSNTFEPIGGRLTLDTDSRTVWFAADEPLLSGVYHHVRIRGGQNGVLGEQDEPLPDDYNWRFLTVPRAVPLSRGKF